jgi:GT2 family glycosyltransferase
MRFTNGEAGEMQISVVIPTYNRCSVLMRTLEALHDPLLQTSTYEVIVVDDGSTDATPTMIPDLASSSSYKLLYMRQANRGPAAARNRGIAAASGDLILFIGDDIIPQPGFIAAHLHAHQAYPQPQSAVLGYTPWHPGVSQTPLAQWWEDSRFRYRALLEGKTPDFSFFYTSNISVKRTFLSRGELFDENFTYAAYEDTDLAYRLAQLGLKIIFAPEALAYHYHETDLNTVCHQMELTGRAYDYFVNKTGQLGLSQVWTLLGTGFWMQPVFIGPLWRLADYLQTRKIIAPLFILVLMYFFQVGRGKRPPLNLPTQKDPH